MAERAAGQQESASLITPTATGHFWFIIIFISFGSALRTTDRGWRLFDP
jgi:hypothetical protein